MGQGTPDVQPQWAPVQNVEGNVPQLSWTSAPLLRAPSAIPLKDGTVCPPAGGLGASAFVLRTGSTDLHPSPRQDMPCVWGGADTACLGSIPAILPNNAVACPAPPSAQHVSLPPLRCCPLSCPGTKLPPLVPLWIMTPRPCLLPQTTHLQVPTGPLRSRQVCRIGRAFLV